MRILQLFLSTFALSNVAFACWDCHPDCSGYKQCKKENEGRDCRRELVLDDDSSTNEIHESAVARNATSTASLRGSGIHRQLQGSYQIKMEWQSYYCVR